MVLWQSLLLFVLVIENGCDILTSSREMSSGLGCANPLRSIPWTSLDWVFVGLQGQRWCQPLLGRKTEKQGTWRFSMWIEWHWLLADLHVAIWLKSNHGRTDATWCSGRALADLHVQPIIPWLDNWECRDLCLMECCEAVCWVTTGIAVLHLKKSLEMAGN